MLYNQFANRFDKRKLSLWLKLLVLAENNAMIVLECAS